MKSKTKWIAIRTPAGELEPVTEVDPKDLEYLKVMAGLQGLTLEEWLLTVLRVSAQRDEGKKPGITVEESMDGNWIELPVSEDLLEILRRQYHLHDSEETFGGFVSWYISFVAYPVHVLLTYQLQGKGLDPEETVDALAEESRIRGNLFFDEEDKMVFMEQHDYEVMK